MAAFRFVSRQRIASPHLSRQGLEDLARTRTPGSSLEVVPPRSLDPPERLSLSDIGEDGRLDVTVRVYLCPRTAIADGNSVVICGTVLLVREQREAQIEPVAEATTRFRRICGDKENFRVELAEGVNERLIAPSLGTAKRSPVTSVPDEDRVSAATEVFVVLDRTPLVVRQGEVDRRVGLSSHRRSSPRRVFSERQSAR